MKKDENYAPRNGALSGIPRPAPIGSAAANRNLSNQPGLQYNSTSAAGYSSKNAQGQGNSRSLLQNIQMRQKKNKNDIPPSKLKVAGAASLHRDANNNSELSQIVATGYVPQGQSVSTPSGNPSGLNIRKAESNQAKGFAPLQPLQPSSRHQSGKDSNPAARMARN